MTVQFGVEIPFVDHLGFRLASMEGGESRIDFEPRPEHMNSFSVAHGGVVMTLLDVVMSMAGRSLDPEARGGVTIEMKTSFMEPGGRAGGRIVARGHAFHRSRTMCFCEGELWDGERLVAKAMGTFKYLKRTDAGPRIEQG